MIVRIILLGLLVVVAAVLPVTAQEQRLDGYFIARSECQAFQSFRKGTNPGNVLTEVDRAYDLISRNNVPASHYRIIIKSASPKERWVALSCGERVVPVAAPRPSPPPPQPASSQTQFVLAASWQPSFCETRPDKTECVSQTADRFDASHFSLHGLWPQPRNRAYCGVSAEMRNKDKAGDWEDLPTPELEPETRASLETVMPGTQSFLDRHEWIKHGTCYVELPAQEYFADSLLVMEALNNSAVQTLFKNNIGAALTGEQIRAAFDDAFGAGAGERVRVACKQDGGRRIITEITIGLRGEIAPGAPIGDLILAAQPTDPGCPEGIVDPVGLQ